MRLGETDPSARRIGPIRALDGTGTPITDFSTPGDVIVKVNDGAWVNAAGSVVVINDELGSPSGYVYYQATAADASVRGFIVVDLPNASGSDPMREEVELFPQGIPVGTSNPSLLVVGPLRATDGTGAPVLGGVGIVTAVCINGAAWAAPGGTLAEASGGYYDYIPPVGEATARGWLAVKITGSCREFVLRVDIVDATFSFPVTALPELAGEGGSTDDRVSGDLALSWSNATCDADVSLVRDIAGLAVDLEVDRGLVTSVILSLFTDRRAENDDVPPSGDPKDRRGWWGDQFAQVAGDRIGSRLWLLDRSVITGETTRRAEEYVREALAWMVDDRVVSSIDVEVEVEAHPKERALIFAVGLNRPGRDPVSFRFAHTWDHLQET